MDWTSEAVVWRENERDRLLAEKSHAYRRGLRIGIIVGSACASFAWLTVTLAAAWLRH